MNVSRIEYEPTSKRNSPSSAFLAGPGAAFVESLGLGPLDPNSVVPLVGRNESCTARTTAGKMVFLKRMIGTVEDSRARLERCTAFLLTQPGRLSAPAHLLTDTDLMFSAHEAVPDAEPASELFDRSQLVPRTLVAVASGIATLHEASPVAVLDASPPRFPSPTLHRHLNLVDVFSLSSAELAAWRLIQGDAALCAALDDLWSATAGAERAPAHCDLRLDQILVSSSSGEAFVTDWEEFRLADPARDPASLLGDLLFRALADAAASLDSDLDDGGADPFLTAGSSALDRVRAHIDAVWATYSASRSVWPDDTFRARVSALVGWHLLDRVLAGAKFKSRLTALDRAIEPFPVAGAAAGDTPWAWR